MAVRAFFVAIMVMFPTIACSQDEPSPRVVSTTPSSSPSIGTPRGSPDISASASPITEPTPSRPPEPPPKGIKKVAGITMDRLPERAARVCADGPPLADACPRIVPAVQRSHPYLLDVFGRPGGNFELLELAAGVPRSDFAKNRPPNAVHIVLETGAPTQVTLLVPTNFEPMPLAEAFHSIRPRPVEVDAGDQGWKRKLILAPTFPSGGGHGDHLVYVDRHKGIQRRISIHLWTPLREPVQVLRAMVRSSDL